MKLTWWNEKTYEDVCDFYLNGERRCAVTNATGTGKTSVLAKVIGDYYDGEGSVMVIAPRDNIVKQYKNPFYEMNDKKIIFKTYSKLGREYSSNYINYTGLKLIVFDELHRIDAKTWRPAVDILADLNPDAKLLGASATPKRTDQKNKDEDMVDVFFNDNRAGNFDIVQCLKLGILPKPIYCSIMYDKAYNEMENDLLDKIYRIKDETTRQIQLNKIKESRINWEASFGYDKIFRTFLDFNNIENENSKIIIFCKDVEHIKEIHNSIDDHLKKLFVNEFGLELTIDDYHNKTSEKPFEEFKNDKEKGRVNILYTIDKLEEGVHVDEVKAIIMFRDTYSEIKYFQQIGRVLSISGSKHPVIIDFVANGSKVKGLDTFKKSGMIIENNLDNFVDYRGIATEGRRDRKRDIPVRCYALHEDAEKLFNEIKEVNSKGMPFTYKEETDTITYFAEKYHKSYAELYNKVYFQNMTITEAIETSLDLIDYEVEYHGEKIAVDVLCKRKNINLNLFDYRYKRRGEKTTENIIATFGKK